MADLGPAVFLLPGVVDGAGEQLLGLGDQAGPGVYSNGYFRQWANWAADRCEIPAKAVELTRIGDDDAALDSVVDEMLRHFSVVQISFLRFAGDDIDLCGKLMKGGDVVISLSGALRDGPFGADRDRFDASREPPPDLAFGHDLRRCVGFVELAWMEMRAACRGPARRCPAASLAVEPGALQFRGGSLVHGGHELPVRLHAAPTVEATPADTV